MNDEVADADVTLLLPGLITGEPQSHQLADYPVINRVTAGASVSQVVNASLESTALNWFHGENAPLQNSAAFVTYRLDYSGATAPPACLRADPVYQQLDINEAILAHSSVLDVQMHESQEIIADLNRHFADDGVVFSCVAPKRWYCTFPRQMNVQTVPPGTATGRSVSLTMVQGVDAGVWRAWLSEIEMLLYSHPVNQLRASSGKSVINSLWLWGEGGPQALSSLAAPKEGTKVFSDQFYVMSLARYLGVEALPVTDFDVDTTPENVLIVDDRLSCAVATGDDRLFESVLTQLETGVFAVLEQLCRRHPSLVIDIWCGNDLWLRVSGRTVAGSRLSSLYTGISDFMTLAKRWRRRR